jgi:sugar-specific transcriptional regulator TrmB
MLLIMQKELEKIGLNKKEVKVYLALLELGQTTIARIADKAKIKRTTVYDVIKTLKQKGLVGRTFKGRFTYYFAEDPRILEKILESKQSTLASVMPQLLSITNFLDKKPQIFFYEGDDSFRNILKDTLEYKGQTIQVWFPNDIGYVSDSVYFEYYIPERLKRRITIHAIVPDNKLMRSYTTDNKKQSRVVKYIGDNDYNINVEVIAYGGEKVSFFSYTERMGVIIKSRSIHDALKSIFYSVWDRL